MAVRVPINGETLRWARLLSHLEDEDLANAAGVSPEKISEFERGETEPTYRQMSQMAKRLDRTLAFFLAVAPDEADIPQTADFRGRADSPIPANLTKEMKRAEEHRRAMLDLAGPSENAIKLGPIKWDNLTERADDLRAKLGLNASFTPPESQPNAAFNFWRGLLEEHGFMVFQTTGVDRNAFRGLSIFHRKWPIILLNGADAANGRIFTLFHEVAHLANRTSGLCLLNEQVREEYLCNSFAASLLMPDEAVQRVLQRDSDGDPVDAMALHFRVSTLAAAIRLRRLGVLDDSRLEEVRAESEAVWEQAREKQARGTGFPPPWRLKYRDLGPAYVGTVARAIEQDRIDWVDATYLLNSRLPMVQQMLAEFHRTGGSN